jgi:hypothetical protein
VLSQPHASDLGAWPWTLDVAPQQLRALNVTILYITPRRIARLSKHRLSSAKDASKSGLSIRCARLIS